MQNILLIFKHFENGVGWGVWGSKNLSYSECHNAHCGFGILEIERNFFKTNSYFRNFGSHLEVLRLDLAMGSQ